MQLDILALRSQINELESERHRLLELRKRNWFIVLAFVGACLIGGYTGVAEILGVVVVAGLVTVGIIFSKYTGQRKSFVSSVKREFVNALLNQIGHDIRLFPERGIGQGEFNKAQLFSQKSDRHKTEDLVAGKYHHTSFYFAEVHAEYKSQSANSKGQTRTTYHSIFDGIILVAEFNKKLQGITVVRPKSGWAIGNFLGDFFNSFRGDVIQLENQAFMQQYTAYSSNQIEARYVLTPLLMERILEIEQKFGRRLNLSFFNSRVYVAFPFRENFFEPNINRPIGVEQFRDEITLVNNMLGVIEALDLNTRIWEN